MVITSKLCLKWVLLVTLSALASFAAAFLGGHDTAPKIAGMLAGVGTFIAIYVLIEAWALSKEMEGFLKSLKVGVIVKIVLQLIPAIEVFTGMVVAQAIDQLQMADFSSAYLKTLIMGVILSGFVFLIASVYRYFHERSKRLAGLAAKAIQ